MGVDVNKTGEITNLVIHKVTRVPLGSNPHAHGSILKSAREPEVSMDDATQKAIEKATTEAVTKALAEAAAKAETEKAAAVEKARAEGATEIQKMAGELAEIQKAQAIGRQIDIAKSLPQIEGTPEVVGDLLYRIEKAGKAAGDATLYADIHKILKAANAQIGKGDLFKTAGAKGGGDTSAQAAVQKAMAVLKAADPKLTDAAAMTAVLTANPELYVALGAEKEA